MRIVSANHHVALTPLAGGVSSDIYRADLPSGVVCVKRALPQLKVAADWQVPVERNRYEVEWMRVAAGIVPHAVPALLGEDRASGTFAMAWLAPDRYPVWKALADGRPRGRPRWRARSATCSAASTPRPPTAPTSPRAFRPTPSSTRYASTPISSPRRTPIRIVAAALFDLVAHHREHEARARARRLQPEEHPDRARRAR